jgi:MATE family multidrug resistance protein
VSVWALRGRHDREIAVLALPALGSLVADPLLSLIDTAFVGRLGADALGALGVSAAVFAVAFFSFNFLEYGTTSLVARAVGAGDQAKAMRASVTALGLAVGSGVVALTVLELFTGPILTAMGATDGVRSQALSYVRIRALAAPAVLVMRAGHGIYRGHQNTSTPFRITAAINAINLVLDPLLIFGAGWDIRGAAWATVIAQSIGAVWFVATLLRRGELRVGRLALTELAPFLRAGRDLTIRTASLLAVFTLGTAVATRISETAVAAHQVVWQLWVFLALAVDALAIAAQALVGRLVGAGAGAEAREVADRLIVLGIAVGAVLALGLAAVAGPLPQWFTDDPAVVSAIRSIYWFLVAGMVPSAVVFVWDGVFFGVGDFAFLAAAMAGSAVLAGGTMLLVLPLEVGLSGVWWSVMMLTGLRLLTLWWRRFTLRGPLG